MLLEYQFTPAIRTAARNTPSADKAVFRAIASWCQIQAIACLLREVGARSEGTGLLGKASWRRWREGEKGLPGKAILSLPQSLTHQPATRQAGTSARRGDLWCPQLTRGAHLQPGAGWRPEGGLGGVKGGGTAPNRGTCSTCSYMALGPCGTSIWGVSPHEACAPVFQIHHSTHPPCPFAPASFASRSPAFHLGTWPLRTKLTPPGLRRCALASGVQWTPSVNQSGCDAGNRS